MDLVTKVYKGLRKPREIVMEVNSCINWWQCSTDYYPKGVNVMEQDWDYLVVLDALRYDIMEEEYDLPGELTPVQSRGAGTREWLRGNFRDQRFDDTVYVNANPQLARIADELNVSFYAVESLWESEWDEELQTVKPDIVREKAIDIAETYPNKRLLIHFIQPHPPFIGPTGQKHDFGGVIAPDDEPYRERFLRPVINSILLNQDMQLWEQAYRESLRLALIEVEELFNELDGKFVVTSDHGELLKERVRPIPIKYVGHRIGCHHENLLTVPWIEYTSGERRDILKEGGETYHSESTDDEVRSRLQQLGYID
ncbi:hypothetical protein [Haloprofundus salilacus]|uniref:hypothetical protein n=1 Tax=Haloprofundus salilacus TaxID=2876190 RepID=UPI001CCD4C68|nr:hypothetical protein [Haloprofundus salilacus]